jgi:hypothetical protein
VRYLRVIVIDDIVGSIEKLFDKVSLLKEHELLNPHERVPQRCLDPVLLGWEERVDFTLEQG